MKKVESVAFDGKTFKVVIDGIEYKKVDKEVVFGCHLAVGEISDERFEEFMSLDDETKCRNYAMSMIARKARTEKEVRNKLWERKFRRASIEKAIEKAKKYGYISDESYAESYAETRSVNSGKRKIKQELKLKGVAEAYIDKALETITEEEEEETALKIARKRLKGSTEKDCERVYRYLISRGIGYDVARRALQQAVIELGDKLSTEETEAYH